MDSCTTKDTKSKCIRPQSTQIQRKSLCLLSMYKSEMHQQLSKQAAQEAHTETETPNKRPLSDDQSMTHTIATLCLHKPWRQQPRPSLEPLYVRGMTNLPPTPNIRTLSISETCSTSPLDEHPEDLEGLEGLETPMKDQMPQEGYPPIISFPFNLQET